jgi:hypothetical protein
MEITIVLEAELDGAWTQEQKQTFLIYLQSTLPQVIMSEQVDNTQDYAVCFNSANITLSEGKEEQ